MLPPLDQGCANYAEFSVVGTAISLVATDAAGLAATPETIFKMSIIWRTSKLIN
jgi:hypothetical protein